MSDMLLVSAMSDAVKAEALAERLGGLLLCDERNDTSHLPFAALVCGATDNLSAFLEASDVGAYLVCRRVIKPRPATDPATGRLPGAIALFPMVAHPDLGHEKADAHWRDSHAPLALKVHVAMSHYWQLSIVHGFKGPKWDGFALCGFDTVSDLRERFFDTPEGEVAIAKDVAKFADGRNSPRRLIATARRFA